MAEDVWFVGKLNDLNDPQQLEELWAWMMKMQSRLNQFDPNSFSLAWIEGAIAGQVIQSMGVGVAPVWEDEVLLKKLTLSGLTASQLVVTDSSKLLSSLATITVALGGTGAVSFTDNGVIYGNATAALGATAEGATGQVLTGVTGSPPAWSATPTVTTATGTTSLVAGTAGNTVTLSATGITLAGTATMWDDLRVIPSSFDFPGVSDPVIGDWQPGGSGRTFKVWNFDQGDVGFFTVQLPHSYKHGTDIYVHVHWTPRDRGTTEGTHTVAWKLDYSWANIDGVFGASTTADMTDACASTNHQHHMSPEVTIDGHTAAKTISSMLMCAIYRDTGDSWSGAGAAQAPALLEVDFHFEMDTLGSNTQSSKT